MKNSSILTINDTLQQNIWSGENLKPEISKKLIEIATKFFKDLELGVELDDITFTGSLANYNWTKHSDIDLHMIVDFQKIDDNIELVREFFNAKTALWNKTHNIFVKGYEIELYVQNSTEDHHSTGVWSVKNNDWIAKPKRLEPEVNTDMVKRKINSFIDMIDRVEDVFEDKDYKKANQMAINLARKIKKFRQSGLEQSGEYSNENLTFKFLRNKGHIKTLYDVRDRSYDKMMSIEGDFDKKFQIFIDKPEKNNKKGFNKLFEIEKFQILAKKRRDRGKKWFIGYGKQKAGAPYTIKPNYKSGISAPPAGE